MANWISSKLKAAESILQQIDQQAAESLRKNEDLHADEFNIVTPVKTGGVVPLKDQLKKKTSPEKNEYRGKVRSDPNSGILNDRDKDTTSASKPSPKPKPTLTDSDWTELLSTPNQSPVSATNGRNGALAIRSLSKNGRRQGSLGSNLLASEVKRNQKNVSSVSKSDLKSGAVKELRWSGKASDGEESSSSGSAGRRSSVELQHGNKQAERGGFDGNSIVSKLSLESNNKGNEENGLSINYKDFSSVDSLLSGTHNHPTDESPASGKVDVVSETKTGVDVSRDQLRGAAKGKRELDAASGSSISDDLKTLSSLASDVSSESASDSGSTSDSESEHEKEERKRRREKLLAEKAAAKAIEAIQERENMVARLEGEKQSLEKILEERAKQQVQEASQLQSTMMETMEAVDLEKQKHNNTRMEALARLAKSETKNAELARSLATVQWNLEMEGKRVAELRQQIELKEVAHEELRRRMSNSHKSVMSKDQLAASKGVEFGQEILEAEYSFLNDKVARLQDKARKLEADIEMTRKEIEDPTEVEVELKRRLDQMTDHLIQKQSQVESLSSEKAGLQFRIEAASRMVDENMSASRTADFASASSRDIESGKWELSTSKLRPLLKDRIHSSREHLGSLLLQLDAIFLAGAVFLKRNPIAKLWALVYVVCLHFWVIYIFMSGSQASNEARSGAVVSLQNINNTVGV